MAFDISSAKPVSGGFDLSTASPVQPPAQPEPSGWQKAQDVVNAPVEAVDAIGTGAVGTIAGGLAAAGASGLKTGLGFLGKGIGLHHLGSSIDPVSVQGLVSRYLTHAPETREGQAVTDALTYPGRKLNQFANYEGGETADRTGSPLRGTMMNLGIQGLGTILSGELGTAGSLVRNSRLVSPLADFASDMLPGGANRAAIRTTQNFAGDGAGAAADTLQQHIDAQNALKASGNSLSQKYGIHPTTAQVANNAGLAAMDRTLRLQKDGVGTVFQDVDAVNAAAKRAVVDKVAGTDTDLTAAQNLRKAAAKKQYENATTDPANITPPPGPDDPSFANELNSSERGLPNPDGTAHDPSEPIQGLNELGVRLQNLLKRPAMKQAMGNAETQAGNHGIAIDAQNLVQQLHWAKIDLDAQIAAADKVTRTGLMATKAELVPVIEALSPAYRTARENFAAMSKPINEMEVGQALKNKYSSALQEMSGVGGTPSAFTNALLRHGDDIARSATDFGGATLEGVMRPSYVEGLHAVADQLAREHFAQTAGRDVGSPTAGNLTNARSLNNIGSLNQISEDLGPAGRIAGMLEHPAIAIPAAIRGGFARRAAQAKLADIAINPESAVKALRAQKSPVSTVAPAVVSAAQPANLDDAITQ